MASKNEAKVTISADIEEFRSAMKQASSDMSEFRSEMRLANAELKNDSGNVQIMADKVKALNGMLQANRDKQAALRTMIQRASDAYGEDSEQVKRLRTQLNNVRSEEAKLEGQIRETNGQIDRQNQGFGEAAGAAEGFGRDAGGSLERFAGIAAAAFSVQKVKEFAGECINAAAELDAQMSAMEQVMGDYSAEAEAKLSAVADSAGSMEGRMRGSFTSLTAKFKGLGFDTEEATDLAARGLTLAADASAFWDKSLDDAQGNLNSFINGSYEGGEAIGLFANDTQLAQYAVQEGIVKSKADWTALDEATKQATRLDYAENMYALSGATGQAAKEADQYANVSANLKQQYSELQAEIGQNILENVAVPAMQAASGWMEQLSQWVQDHQEQIDAVTTAIGNAVTHLDDAALAAGGLGAALAGMKLLQFVGQAGSLSAAVRTLTASKLASRAATVKENIENTKAGAIAVANAAKTAALTVAEKARTVATKAATVAQKAMNMAMKANPAVKLVAILMAVVGAIVALWNKSEAFRNFFINLWDTVKTKVGNAIDWIKEKLHFQFELPHMKLPHFAVDPPGWKVGDLVKGVIPKLGVEWYAKGAVLMGPTIFGARNGRFMAGGEAGPEAVAPISTLQGYIADAVQYAGAGGGNTYIINGITYDDGSNVAHAVEQLVDAANIRRRIGA